MDYSTMAQVAVDLRELQHFASKLRAEADGVFEPAVSRADGMLGAGAGFGVASVSGEVSAARDAVDAALDQARANTVRQLRAAQILVRAAEQVLANYSRADELSNDQLRLVQTAFGEAVAQANAVLTRTEEAPDELTARPAKGIAAI